MLDGSVDIHPKVCHTDAMPLTGQAKRDYQREWMRKRRQAWIDSQGSKCVLCGETELPFEVDHIDPKTKVSHAVWSWSKERQAKELAKCQLLCQACHWKKTGAENATGRNHGETMYKDGCRCDVCVTTRAVNKKRIRADRKLKGLPYQ